MKNLTKTIALSLILMVFGINVNAQYTKQKTGQLILRSDSMDVNGLKTMVDFMVKQDAQLYQNGVTLFTNERDLLNDLAKNGLKPNDVRSTSSLESYLTMCNNDFKDRVLSEKATDRTVKVTWNGQPYKISKHFKMTYDMLMDFIKMSQSNLNMDQGLDK
jgi:hypothetical protein